MALEKTVNEKIAAAQPTQAAKKQGESQYIRLVIIPFPLSFQFQTSFQTISEGKRVCLINKNKLMLFHKKIIIFIANTNDDDIIYPRASAEF